VELANEGRGISPLLLFSLTSAVEVLLVVGDAFAKLTVVNANANTVEKTIKDDAERKNNDPNEEKNLLATVAFVFIKSNSISFVRNWFDYKSMAILSTDSFNTCAVSVPNLFSSFILVKF
jgi:hypothetical protein